MNNKTSKLPLKYQKYGLKIKEALEELGIYNSVDNEFIEQAIEHKYMADMLFDQLMEIDKTDIKTRSEIDNMRVRSIKLHNYCMDKMALTPYQRNKLEVHIEEDVEDPFEKIQELMNG